MYPRNAASPPRIALGPVVQISDGAVQSSGVSVAVRPEGGSETAGGGTVSYGGSSSVVYYVPTQAETNYTAFVVVAYKTGCIPVAVTVVTTASATSGTTNVAAINSVATTSVTAVNANVGTTQPTNFTGTGGSALVKADTVDIAGAAVSTSSAQIGVNVVNVNAVSAASVTTISANLGTAQPVNFTGTGASALAKSDVVDIAGAAVNAASAQLGVNVVNFGGSAGTFSSGKPAVTVASTDVTGNVAADLQTIKTQTVTCAGGVTVPAATLASTTNITAGTITTATNLTNNNDKSGYNVTSLGNNTVTAASIASGAMVAAVWDGSVTGHTTVGTFGGSLNAAGSAGDPWATSLPGSYTAGSAGYIVGQQLGAAFTTSSSSVFTTSALQNAPTGGGGYTPAQIATAVWQDATAGDFTVAGSIGKSLFTSGATPGATGGLLIAGANAATTFATLTSTGAFTINGTATVAQTGDAFARIGSTGSGLTSLAPSATALSTAQWTNTLATNLGTLAGHDPGATLASQTNITAGTITTVTNLTNAPTAGDFTTAMKASLDAATPALSAAGNNAVADAALGRNVAGGSSGGRTVSQALYVLRNKIDTQSTPGTLIVYGVDDATPAWTATLTTDAAAAPIVTSDPA